MGRDDGQIAVILGAEQALALQADDHQALFRIDGHDFIALLGHYTGILAFFAPVQVDLIIAVFYVSRVFREKRLAACAVSSSNRV